MTRYDMVIQRLAPGLLLVLRIAPDGTVLDARHREIETEREEVAS